MRIIKQCKIDDLPEGSLFRILNTNLIYLKVNSNYEYSGEDISSICLDKDEPLFKNSTRTCDIELLRNGFDFNLNNSKLISIRLDYQNDKLLAVIFVKHLLSIGLKEAKENYLDKAITNGDKYIYLQIEEQIYDDLIYNNPKYKSIIVT